MKPYEGPTIVIVGPTASGKTGVAIEIAKELSEVKELSEARSASSADALLTRRMSNTARSATPASSHNIASESSWGYTGIISADSRAIYKGMDIGTAKPSMAERQGVTHYGFDLVEPGERFTVADWKEYAEQKICSIRERGGVPIVCGGTGLYIDALVYNYQFDKEYSDRLEMAEGFEIFGIDWPKEILRERLRKRVDKLFVQELFDETTRLVEAYGWGSQAMKSDIYEYAWGYLQGEYGLEKAKELCFYEDYHLAKRQMTWFKRNPEIKWLPLEQIKDAALTKIKSFC